MEKNPIEIISLPSGLKLVCKRMPGAPVEYCGAVIKVGSRDDGPLHPGIAHFVEHTIFKGTVSRSSWHILNRMERVGGEINAYTSKEETVVYTAAQTGNASRAIELIADLLANSQFPQKELDKEREVVADEINSYLDSPADAVYDDFEELIFDGSPLAHNILGTPEALSTFDSALCQKYIRQWYAADNMVFFYCGSSSAQRIAQLVQKHFAALPSKALERQAPQVTPVAVFEEEKKIGSHQAHTVMGCRTEGLYGSRRFPLALLTNILGGPGMNSRLNVALREKRGYVYSVEASTTLFTDTGLFNVYFGCDPADTEKCKALVRRQIEELSDKPLSSSQLSMAKKQYLGQLAVASDNRENSSISMGRASLFFPRPLSRTEVEERVLTISAADLMETASALLQLSSLTLC